MTRNRVTALLSAVANDREPDRQALDRLVPLVYDELRRMARAQLAGDREHLTLDTTALVHEAYFKLVDAERAPLASRGYFFGAAARAMRQVLVDAARRRRRQKRGGGVAPATLDDETVAVEGIADEMIALDEALERLATSHPRPARVVECRYFGGMSIEETADALDLGSRTVNRDLTFAQAWLRRELGTGSEAMRSFTGAHS